MTHTWLLLSTFIGLVLGYIGAFAAGIAYTSFIRGEKRRALHFWLISLALLAASVALVWGQP